MAHHGEMNCPICSVSLVMSDRQGIEIDYCPKCRGVWLDRGELDKIIERSMTAAPTASQAPAPAQHPYQQPQHHGHQPAYYQKRRKSFLEELFD